MWDQWFSSYGKQISTIAYVYLLNYAKQPLVIDGIFHTEEYDNDCDEICNICGFKRDAPHLRVYCDYTGPCPLCGVNITPYYSHDLQWMQVDIDESPYAPKGHLKYCTQCVYTDEESKDRPSL